MSALQPDRLAWVLYVGDPLWHQRLVLGRLRRPAAIPIETWRLIIVTPDGDVHDEDYSGLSPDIAAIWVSRDRARPPGITRQDSYRFRREPTAAEVTAHETAGETYAAAVLAQDAAGAGVPFVAGTLARQVHASSLPR